MAKHENRKWVCWTILILVALLLPASISAGGAKVDVFIGFQVTPGAAEQALVHAVGGEIRYSYSLVPAIAARLPEAAVSALQRNPNVTVIEPVTRVYAVDYASELDNTWGVKRVGAGDAHLAGYMGSGVKVAIVDSGVACGHVDLAGRCVQGYDFVNDDSDPADDNGHGTHVAGTVAAVRNGGGVVGAAPLAQLFPLKVLGADGSGDYGDVIAALQWAVDHNMQITSNSYGSSSDPGSLVQAAFDNAYTEGLLNVCAAGNSGNRAGVGDSVIYPARYASCIAVAATDQSNKRASFSSTGALVELAAPGVSINSTVPSGGYEAWSGTSMATPHVSGVAALLWGKDSSLINVQIREAMNATALDLGVAGRDNLYGNGLVQAMAALDYVGGTTPTNQPPVANFTSSCSGLECTFTSTSTDPDGNETIVSHEWSLGDGSTASGTTVTHPYVAGGAYQVALKVTDDGGLTNTKIQSVTAIDPNAEITLSATWEKVKSKFRVYLVWSGAVGANVDIYRNGTLLITTPNDGAHTDSPKAGTYNYKVCEVGTSTCSNEEPVTLK